MCAALQDLSGSALSSARISANTSLSSGLRQTNKAALNHKHPLMTKGLRQQGATSVIATFYLGSQGGGNSLEVIERAPDLWDAARKSLSIKTRRRIKPLPCHQLQHRSRINPGAPGSFGRASLWLKGFLQGLQPAAPGTAWPPGPVYSSAASP